MSNRRRRVSPHSPRSPRRLEPGLRLAEHSGPGSAAVEASLRATDPSELLAVVPYLLGYQPHESLVLVVLVDGRVGMCARMDLTLAAHPVVLGERLRSIVAGQPAEGVVLLGFGAAEPARVALSVAMTALAQQPGVPLVEAAHTDGSRWWSMTCSGPCCPSEGTPFDQQGSRLAAEAVWAGLTLADSRDEIARTVDGPPASIRPELRSRATAIARKVRPLSLPERQHRLRELIENELIESGLSSARDPDPAGGDTTGPPRGDAASAPQPRPRTGCSEEQVERWLELAVLVGDIAVRDIAWALMGRTSAAEHVDLWRRVVGVCVPELATPALCLLGVAAWIAGDGTLQVCCLERAETLDPAYTMVGLLSDLNARAAPPSMWDELGPAIREVVDPSGAWATS